MYSSRALDIPSEREGKTATSSPPRKPGTSADGAGQLKAIRQPALAGRCFQRPPHVPFAGDGKRQVGMFPRQPRRRVEEDVQPLDRPQVGDGPHAAGGRRVSAGSGGTARKRA